MKIWSQEEEAAHLRERFKDIENKAAFAREWKFPGGSSMLSQNLSGHRKISLDAGVIFAKAFKCSLADISPRLSIEIEKASPLLLIADEAHRGKPIEIDIDSELDLVKIKRVDLKLSAGITGYSVEVLNSDLAPIVFRKDWIKLKRLNVEKLFALKVSGQSMETSLYDGDLVVVNTEDTKMVDGEVYAVNYEGELVIKRMIRQGGDWLLSSDNHDKRKYADKLCHENCIVIGRVIYKQSERI